MSGLPGEELLEAGLADLRRGEPTVPALLVSIGAPRLRRLGLDVPEVAHAEYPELLLYRRLRLERPDDAYGQYNSLLRTLISYEHARERAWAQARGATERPMRGG